MIDYELSDGVAHLRFDDGKANALSHPAIRALHSALDRAEGEASAVVLEGRPSRLSAGFDLAVMTSGPAAARALVTAGGELLIRMYASPVPIVVACTGHALAAGAILLLAADLRVGVSGEFKIGLNEVEIGIALPEFAVVLARDRLSPRCFHAATAHARIFAPEAALAAGFLDAVVAAEALRGAAMAEARTLAALPAHAYRRVKQSTRGEIAARLRAGLEADVARLVDAAAS